MPNYYNKVDWRGADRDEASAIHAKREIGVEAFMAQPGAPTIYDPARHLCAEQGITNPRPSLVQALVEQAFPDS